MVGVMVILSLIVVFTFPIIINTIKDKKSEISDYRLDMLKNATDLFVDKNSADLNQNGTGCIPLATLVNSGYIKKPIKLGNSDTDITDSKSILYPYEKSNFTNYIVDSDDTRCNAIPVAYRRVRYIEGTGTQYIDTNYKPNPSTGIEVMFQFNDLTYQQRVFGIDSSDNSNPLSYSLYINGSGKLAYAYQNGKGNWRNLGVKVNTLAHNYEFNVTSGSIMYDSKQFTINTNPTNTSAYNLLIMARNNYTSSGVKVNNFASIKIYTFKIYENGTLIRDYVPCYRTSDGVIGMYDKVGNSFYTNAGAGEFKKGENINFS
jgi:hypothetical protein